MSYAFRLLVVAGAALALTSCGGSSKSESAASTTQSQPAQSGAATGITGASGASGATSSQTAPGKRKRSTGGASRPNGTGGSGLPANTSGGNGSSGTGDRTANDQKKKSDTAARRKAQLKARRERDAAPFFTSPQVYKQGKGGCHLLGINAIAREYRAASFKPKDVATAYANAWVKGGAPERSRNAMYRGCLAGLRENLAGR